jgi:hypothetical protein
MRAIYSIPVALLILAPACGGSEDPPAGPDAAPPVTWHQNVAPIVAEHCMGCHSTDGLAPFALETYDDAEPASDMMLDQVQRGKMPPWDAVETDDCNPRNAWRDDPRLSAEEIDTIRAWVEGGSLPGDPATAAPLPEPVDIPHIDGVTHRLWPETGYVTSGVSDQFICWLLDPQLSAPAWLEALEFEPGNPQVVHHATLTAIPAAAVPAVQALEGPDGSFDCFGGAGAIEGAYPLGVWVPGSNPFEPGEGIGIPLAAGTQMLMQIHYHPHGTIADPDLTEVAMRLTTTAPAKNLVIAAVGNAAEAPLLLPGPNDPAGGVEFRIPANMPDHTETMRFPIEADTTQRFPVLAVFPHMHYIGVDLDARIERASPAPGEPAEECLFKTPQWDFNWQRTYTYDAPIYQLPTIGDGDVITLQCRYDNTLANPFVERALEDRGIDDPIDVYLGEETLDEMCLIAVFVMF